MKARLLTDIPLFGLMVATEGTGVIITDENPQSDPVEVTVLLWNGEDFDEYPFFVSLDDLEIIEDDE